MLTQVWPALFPGQNLWLQIPVVKQVQDFAAALPGPAAIKPPGQSSAFNRRITILVLGVDRRPRDSEFTGNTDSLMVFTTDPFSHDAAVVGIPRDLWVNINLPDGTQYPDRINASFAPVALAQKSVDAGAKQLEHDLKVDLGIDVDYWVWLDIGAVEGLVNLVDGLDVNIPTDLAVPSWYYTDDDATNPHYVSFPPGLQHLNGYNAVAFGRYRNDSDLYRIRRQQLVIQAAVAKILAAGALNDPFGLWDAGSRLFKTDIPTAKLPGYALLAKDVAPHLRSISLGDPVDGAPTVSGWQTPGGASVLTWDKDKVGYWLGQAFSSPKYAGMTVELDSATTDLADPRLSALGRYLKTTKGFPVVEIGPGGTPALRTQILLFNQDKRAAAQDVARWLGLRDDAITAAPKTNASQPDFEVVLGPDVKVPEN